MPVSDPAPKGRADHRIIPRLKPARPADGRPGTRRSRRLLRLLLLLLLTGGALLLVYHLFYGDEGSPSPIVINADGEEVLAPEQQAKLDREMEEIDHAVQYVLLATDSGIYPCCTCPDGSLTIFLYENEVWRYGVTRKGEKKRYPGENYGTANVRYVEQFEGTYSECLKMEKFMIYNYPLLPEAKRRAVRLFRPPGNKNDS